MKKSFLLEDIKVLLNSLPYDVVDTLDKSTDKIIDFSGDPQLKMDTRGLVMGEVQSGKTASYTGVICKAADLGYKVIIVVTTSNEKLRSQTQQRLDKEFVGYCNVSQMSTINIPGFLTGEEKKSRITY